VDYLVAKKGFRHYSVRAFLIEEIKKRNLSIDRDSMREIANELRATYSPSYIVEQLYLQAEQTGKDVIIESIHTPAGVEYLQEKGAIIESIRAVGEVEALKSHPNFLLLAIDADQKLRYERAMTRGNESDHVSFEKFQEQEKAEMHNDDTTKQNIARCMEMANFTVYNNGEMPALYQQLDEFIEKFIS
jgi:dephospho-CoA kinase